MSDFPDTSPLCTSQNPLPGGDEMSMVNADSVQLFAMLKKCRIPFPPSKLPKICKDEI